MVITATDFQLRVNEYFTKVIQGEEVIVERYGKKFAVLLSYADYQDLMQRQESKTQVVPKAVPAIEQSATQSIASPLVTEPLNLPNSVDSARKVSASDLEETLTPKELLKLIKLLLKE